MTAAANASNHSPEPRSWRDELGQIWTQLADHWDQDLAGRFAERIDDWFDHAEAADITRLGDLAAYLASFVEAGREPNTAQRIRLASLVELICLNEPPVETTKPASQPAAIDHPTRDKVATLSPTGHRPRTQRLALCLLGIGDRLAPGLSAALSERGYELHPFQDASALRDFLALTIPGAVIVNARQLRALPALIQRWKDAPAPPAVIVLSPDRDLTHRLLALRAGAVGFFAAPLDAYRIAARVDELLGRKDQPPYRVLIVEDQRDEAIQCGQWIAGEGMTARIAPHGAAAIAALGEFQPDAVLIDASLPDTRGVDLVQMIRQQPEHATLPIVLTSSAGDAGERFDAIAAGADEVLLKPLKARHVVGVIRSRVQRAQWLRAQAEASAARDPKTGLYSRALVMERIPARIGTQGSALMLISFDDRDRLHEEIGSSSLAGIDVELGARLRDLLAPHDLLCTLRDFSWLLLLTRERRDQIAQLAERVRFAVVERPLAVHPNPLPVTASVAMVALDEEAVDADGAVRAAEKACREAGTRGGNLALWSQLSSLNAGVDPVLAVRAVLSRPLDARNLRVEYRPLVPLKGTLHDQFDFQFYLGSSNDAGARGSYGLCAQVANELGVRPMLEQARFTIALQARQHAREGRTALRLHLPVTADWLLDEAQIDWLLDQLQQRHLAAAGFTFELTGADLLDHREALMAPINRLREAGVRFGISDYGRDFAAVHILTQLPVDVLRLDGDLLEATATAHATNPTLLALVRKAHQLGAAVVAPGMHTLDRAHVLLRVGVDYGVGNAFGTAQTTPEFDFNRPLW